MFYVLWLTFSYNKFTLMVLNIKIVIFFSNKMITLQAMLHKLDEENIGKSTRW